MTEEQIDRVFDYLSDLIETKQEWVDTSVWICGDYENSKLEFKVCSDLAVSDIKCADWLLEQLTNLGLEKIYKYRERGLSITGKDLEKLKKLAL